MILRLCQLYGIRVLLEAQFRKLEDEVATPLRNMLMTDRENRYMGKYSSNPEALRQDRAE